MNYNRILRLSCLTVLAWLFAGLAAACAAPAPASSPAADTSQAPAASAAAASGGTLRAAYVEEPQGLDPALATIGASHQVIEQIYSTLTKLDPESNPQPDLAESWDISDDGKTYTFKLRPGVLFHNGQPLTADDVVFSFERLLDPATGYSYATMVEMIDSVVAEDPATVRFELSNPTGPFLRFLAFPGASIVPKAEVEARGNLSDMPIGTGPFKFVEYQPGTKIVLERNPDYYEEGKPKLDKLEMYYIADDTERTNALLGGLVDFATRVSPRDFDTIVSTEGFTGTETLGGRWYWLMVNTQAPPFDNPKVRQAVSLALDRQAMVDLLFFGHAEPILGGVIPSWNWAYAKDLATTPPTGDVEQAKKLLAEAGYPDGLDATVTLGSAWPNLVEQGPIIKDSLAKIGVRAELQSMENPRYMELVWSGGEYQLSNMFWLSPLADPDDFMYLNYKCGSPMNPQQYCNEELDGLLEQARYTTDEAERTAIYKQAQELAMNEMPLIPTVNASMLDAFSTKVQGYVPMRTGMYSTFDSVSVAE